MTPNKRSALTTMFRSAPGAEVARLRDNGLPAADKARTPTIWRSTRQLRRRIMRWWPLLVVVVLPSLLASIYYFAIASDQYVSEAHFMVRGQNSSGPSLLGLGAILGSAAGMHTAQEESLSVGDFMKSHDAVQALQKRLDLVSLFRRPEADFISRLWTANPSAERLLEYYENKVNVVFESTSGLTTLRVSAFRPDDSWVIADNLLIMGEDLVNRFSERAQADTLRVSRDEVSRAEARLLAAREAITTFRDLEKSLDPGKASATVLEVIAKLEGFLAQTRAELTEASTYLKPDNAKYIALRNKAEALDAQIASEKKRLTGGDGSLAPVIAAYERLVLEREFADKGYASALVSLENARLEAGKQHLYLVRVVEPNLPERALYPRRLILVATVFFGSLLIYGIGWLILAGVREHAA